MTEFEIAHGLSQDHPGPLEPVELAQQPGAAPATGNTARDQEMYAAGIETGEENAKHNAAIRAAADWLPIETAPQTGRTLLLGYWNSFGKWRTVRGQWMSLEYIAEHWEDPDDAEAGWFETAVEADDAPNCWPVSPSHWQPMPAAPCQTCNGHGAVGNILNAEPCPDCTSAPTSHPIPTGATGEDAEQVRHKMNADLCAFYMRWEADGDYLRCRKCKRPQIASYAEKGFPHAAGCKAVGNVEQRPWLALVELMRPLIGSVAPAAGDALRDRDAALEAVRKRLCALPRYSFLSDGYGAVRRVEGKSGSWIGFDAAHELFDPVCVDAAIAQQKGEA
jgi:hypothetical protein